MQNKMETRHSVGASNGLKAADEKRIAIAGNPNVGKSTLFNALTNMAQHTGNWTGKTVESACGHFSTDRYNCLLVDLPGTYSLMAHSAEEEIARDYICFDGPDAVLIVCDATCLERNLNLVLQILEISGRSAVCVNLMDEAKRKGIKIDLDALSRELGVPVIGTVAREKRTLSNVHEMIDTVLSEGEDAFFSVHYDGAVEREIGRLSDLVKRDGHIGIAPRFAAIRLLIGDEAFQRELIQRGMGEGLAGLEQAIREAQHRLREDGYGDAALEASVTASLVRQAEAIAAHAVSHEKSHYNGLDRKLDHIFTGQISGTLIMLLFLMLILFLTITGANVPSRLLSEFLMKFLEPLRSLFTSLGLPPFLTAMLADGGYRVLAFVVSVMLPPMAIFFPLFTLLEDAGYLPRIAYNLDRPFSKCSACGKQALSMCMGFGCNAAGVVGCRIIDSPRERLIATLTNSFVPCNGRFAPPQQGKESCFRCPRSRTRKSNFP